MGGGPGGDWALTPVSVVVRTSLCDVAIRWDGWLLRAVCAAVAFGGAADVLRRLTRARTHQQPIWVKVRAIDNVGAEVGAYLASCLLPLLTAPDPSTRDLAAYGFFLALSAAFGACRMVAASHASRSAAKGG